MIILFTTKTSRLTSTSRIRPVDMVRGIFLILMTLGSARGTQPTHLFEIPFVFLAGTSAWFIQGRKTARETAFFLLTRGIWLVLLQWSVVSFGYSFDPRFHNAGFGPLSDIGFSMMTLAVLIYLPFYWLMGIALLLALTPYLIPGMPMILEDIGVISLGFCFGSLYTGEMDARKRRLLLLTLDGKLVRFLTVLGRVPLLYYLFHIYLTHLLLWILGSDAFWLIAPIVVAILYPCCRSYSQYKKRNPEKWWLRYL